jgi:hypothetical protein
MNEVWRGWYRNPQNRARHLRLVASRRKRRNLRNKQIVIDVKTQPCADCGNQFPPYVMDFDHVADKTADVSSLVYTHSSERLFAEIQSCDVVCANCHRVRTQRRLAGRLADNRQS